MSSASPFSLSHLQREAIWAHGQQTDPQAQALIEALDPRDLLVSGRDLVDQDFHEGLGVNPLRQIPHLKCSNVRFVNHREN